MFPLPAPVGRPMRPLSLPFFTAGCLAMFLAGCGGGSPSSLVGPNATALSSLQSSAAPGEGLRPPAASRSLVDLTTGNRATYEDETRMTLDYDDPNLPADVEVFQSSSEWVVTGPVTRFRTEYVRVDVSFTEQGEPMSNVRLYRQDGSGLYEVFPALIQEGTGTDASSARIDRRLAAKARSPEVRAAFQRAIGMSPDLDARPAGKPGGPLQHEAVLLRYPLHPGASWQEPGGSSVWTVQRREDVSLPGGSFSAWRIEHSVPGTTNEYQQTEWYSTPGRIAYEGGTRYPVLDVSGQRLGTMTVRWSHRLTSWAPAASGS